MGGFIPDEMVKSHGLMKTALGLRAAAEPVIKPPSSPPPQPPQPPPPQPPPQPPPISKAPDVFAILHRDLSKRQQQIEELSLQV